MSITEQLSEDVVADIETWERHVHPLVRDWERLLVARKSAFTTFQGSLPSGDHRAAPEAVTAYANLVSAWVGLMFAWLDPATWDAVPGSAWSSNSAGPCATRA
jgi:hypothetical protein